MPSTILNYIYNVLFTFQVNFTSILVQFTALKYRMPQLFVTLKHPENEHLT